MTTKEEVEATKQSEPEWREIAYSESGQILWNEPYEFKRLSRSGEHIVRGGAHYFVVSSKAHEEKIITTIVKETPTP